MPKTIFKLYYYYYHFGKHREQKLKKVRKLQQTLKWLPGFHWLITLYNYLIFNFQLHTKIHFSLPNSPL